MVELRHLASSLPRSWEATDEQIVQFVDMALKHDPLSLVQGNSPVRQMLHKIKKRSSKQPLSSQALRSLSVLREFMTPPPVSSEDKAAGTAAMSRILGENVNADYAQLSPVFATLDRLRRDSNARKTLAELQQRVNALITEIPPITVQATDAFGTRALADVQPSGPAAGAAWSALLAHAQSLKSTVPSKVWKKRAAELQSDVAESWISVIEKWFDEVGQPSPVGRSDPYGGTVPPTVLNSSSGELLKGLVWACAAADIKPSIPLLGRLAQKSFQKIPGVGSRSPKVGNACVNALATFDDPPAIAELARLQSKARSVSIRSSIAKAFDVLRSRTGLSFDDLFEISLPAYGLQSDCTRKFQFGENAADLCILGSSEVSVGWLNANGKPSKSIPVAVKRDHAIDLKELRQNVKDLSALLKTIISRLEKQFMTDRAWPLDVWQKRYMQHPVAWHIAKNLIWNFGPGLNAVWFDGRWIDANDRPVMPAADVQVRLWHPITSTTEQVHAWRIWLERNQIVQPFKQAHREIYVLTDAERATSTYSNRFAAHILRQHQFNALCQQRGWVYRLQGAFDSHNTPTLDLPNVLMHAEFWVEGVASDVAASGIYLYVSTDQVRLTDRAHEPIPLEQIRPQLLSEVMRDVDLFVGVTSVGNDPTWQDGGPEGRYQAYWQNFSFGELSMQAGTRRDLLSRLIPRLKIADRCSLNDRFLVVRGNLRTYKIHLGSGNILMEPNDQYLCIVPDRGRTVSGGDVFLPFEGDSVLSVILSKAFLLAADDKIKDTTITRQIQRT
jgi:hypothetical protein